jgi:phospholipid/cholesterol/gamma-HCH transport system permease protein
VQVITYLGTLVLNTFYELGCFALFLFHFFAALCTTKIKTKQLTAHMKRIGVDSFPIIVLSSLSIGFALALQTYIGLSRFGGEEVLGVVVALGITRELGPVVTALMVTGRNGSAMAAEIGTMQITEQVDALCTLRIDPYQYLIVPRILAATIILPFLTIFAMACGILGGYLYTAYASDINPGTYITGIQQYIMLKDIIGGLIKASFFGFILATIGTYMGYTTRGGAEGVGQSTTQSVVVASIVILVANYLLSSFLFKVGI